MRKSQAVPIWIKILLWITVTLTAIYLLSAFIGYADPNGYSFLPILGLAYPIMLSVIVLSTVFWLFLHRKYALIPLAAIIVTIPQISAFSPINYNRFWSERQESDFALMTYNTFGFKGIKKGEYNSTVAEILKYDPDFVCMQETPKIKDLKSKIDGNQLALLEKRYPYMGDSDSTSMSFLSKHPAKTVYSYHDKKYFAFCVYETQALGDTAFIFSLHLESIGLTPSDKELYLELTSVNSKEKSLRGVRSRLMTKLANAFKNRAKQAVMIRQMIDSLQSARSDAGIFVCGDFNDTPYSYSYLTVKGDLRDAYTDAGIGPTYTYNANRFYFKIDQLFYKGDKIEAISTRRGNSRSSDHYPLISIFRKKENN